ncbi:hypothetical protein BG846_02418 [Streptomyces fradiae ATCC 10745 = DSM 40063]|uniref:Uncharacterized protein n=1 Tax=Streptomyces fradiae ATCC 10745 = DSM 40063 TaxID=1319510 RepID=A0A1Y2NWR6_STRFR|nr:hypothetical protein BG846_02418 [Streptomyces fradiae ATCC 10745 = DSM 40063]
MGRHRGGDQPPLDGVAAQVAQALPGLVVLHALGDDEQAEGVGQVHGAADDLGVLRVDGEAGHEGAVDLQFADREAAQVDQGRVARAEVVQGHLHAVTRQPGEGVGGTLRVLQQDVLRYLQLEGGGGHVVAGQAGGDGPREAGAVHVARGDVHRDGDLQALGAPAGDLAEGRLQDVLREVGHQAGGLGDGDELVRGDAAALRVDPADQRLQAGDVAVEADLGLVVQLHLARVEGAAQVAEEAEPVGRVGVPLGLVHLDAGAVALRLVHGHVGALEEPLRVEGVVGEDGDARAGLQDERESVEVERGGEVGGEVAGDPLGAGRGIGHREENGEFVAAEPGGLRAAREGEAQPLGDLEEEPVAGEVAERVVDGPEAVEVDEDERAAPAVGLGGLQGRPGPFEQPLAVGEAGERVAELLLGAGTGDPEGGVERD